MIGTFYVIARRGKKWSPNGDFVLRTTADVPTLAPGEVAVKVNLEIDRAAFENPPIAEVTIKPTLAEIITPVVTVEPAE